MRRVLLLTAAAWLLTAAAPAVQSDRFMVVTAHRLASEAGAEMLRAGGNAVDAAVAIGYAEAVVNPCCGNIGGGGFMVAHLADGRDVFLDFREAAPAAATANMYLDPAGKVIPGSSMFGWRSVGVPGSVLGLETALIRFGTMTRAQVMAPAIRLARDGFLLAEADTAIIDAGSGRLDSDAEARQVFLHADHTRLRPGERLVQSALADTLAAIAEHGPDAFYHGAIPKAVAAAAHAANGIITEADFAAYTVQEAAPLRCPYRGRVFVSAPPPSSGGTTLCEILAVLEGYDLHAMGFHTAASVHVMAEAMRHAYLDRNTLLGDPAFVHNPVDLLTSPEHAAALRAAIGERATASRTLLAGTPPHEKPETTHYSVMDAAGNAVAVTYTVNGLFGAAVMAPGTGFVLNDEMDDFSIKPDEPNMFGLVQGEPNVIAPGKRPLSSMAPTVVLRDGHVDYVLGSPGGSRIITIVLETALNVIDHAMTPPDAVAAPRLHLQYLPDTLYAEPGALSPDTATALRGMGYTIAEQPPWGAAELIAVGPGGILSGASDPRRPAGLAIGR